MRTRRETWVIGNLMAIVPLITWILTQAVAGYRAPIRPEATRELLFYALSASSIALIATHDTAGNRWTQVATFIALLLTIGSAIVYGEFLFGETLRAAMDAHGVYHPATILAIGALITSTAVEFLTHGRLYQ